ncbi:hypothetical protein LP419_18530 [Massilia sp. H-1]|nr:hypothetical protein LP419_18530 [Massilia sp. H-1]
MLLLTVPVSWAPAAAFSSWVPSYMPTDAKLQRRLAKGRHAAGRTDDAVLPQPDPRQGPDQLRQPPG